MMPRSSCPQLPRHSPTTTSPTHTHLKVMMPRMFMSTAATTMLSGTTCRATFSSAVAALCRRAAGRPGPRAQGTGVKGSGGQGQGPLAGLQHGRCPLHSWPRRTHQSSQRFTPESEMGDTHPLLWVTRTCCPTELVSFATACCSRAWQLPPAGATWSKGEPRPGRITTTSRMPRAMATTVLQRTMGAGGVGGGGHGRRGARG